MEGSMKCMNKKRGMALFLGLLLSFGFTLGVHAQEETAGGLGEGKAQLRLGKTVKTPEVQGQSVEGKKERSSPGIPCGRFGHKKEGSLKKAFSVT